MHTYALKPNAFKELNKLSKDTQKRIIRKLDYFTQSDNPLVFAEALINFELGSYRYRVGDYRIIFDLKNDVIVILSIGHRRDIYK